MRKLKKHPDNWQFLHAWFRPIWLKLLIPWFALIPLFLTIFRDVPQVITFGSPEAIELDFRLPFKWWLLWGASFAYALAFAIFATRCPAFIRQYPTYRHYESRGHSPRWIACELSYAIARTLNKEAVQRLLKRLVEKQLASRIDPPAISSVDPEVSERGSVYRFEYLEACYEFVATEKSDAASRVEKEVFWEILGPLASSRTASRHTTWALLYISAGLLVVAIWQNVWVVLKYFALQTSQLIAQLCDMT